MNALANDWSPAQTPRDELQPEDERSNEEPTPIANLKEACAHLAHVPGMHGLSLQDGGEQEIDDDTLLWLLHHGSSPHVWKSTTSGGMLMSVEVTFAGVRVVAIVPASRVAEQMVERYMAGERVP